ncbi:MAG: hybrid sensor histidine kinase/response regulator [Gammaproteobacteria bacterium]
MTASQAEKLSALVSEVSLQLSELASISRQLANHDAVAERLNKYRNIIQQISITIEQSEYSGLFDLVAILQEGVTALIEQNRNPNRDELYFLTKLPEKLLDYISYPTSKLPGLVLLRLFKHQGWIRPISIDEEHILTEFMLPTENKADDGASEVAAELEAEHLGLDFETNRDQVSAGSETVSLSDFVPQDDESSDDLSVQELTSDGALDNIEDRESLVEFNNNDESSESLLVDLGVDEPTESDDGLLVDLDTEPDIQSEHDGLMSFELEDFETPESFNEDLDVEVDISGEIDITGYANDAADGPVVDELLVEQDAGQNEQNIVMETAQSAIDVLTEESDAVNETTDDIVEDGLFEVPEDSSEQPAKTPDFVDLADVEQAIALSDIISDDETEDSRLEMENPSPAELLVDTIELDDSVLREIDNTPLIETVELEDTHPKEASPANAGLNEDQQELVDLIRAELAEIIDERDQLRDELEQAQDIVTLVHHLMNISEQAENISNAVKLMGLEGMAECAVQISRNVKLMAEQQQILTPDQLQLVYDWPIHMLAVLQNIYASQPAEALVEFLSADHWQQPLASDRQQQVLESLQHPDFVEEEVEQRQLVAAVSDVTLQLPEDVNMELLEGLLQDLPAQTEEFSSALQGLQVGDMSQLDVAQRIAHTLKGAANVVGVKGIANLTHHLEDILQVLTKAGKKPSSELHNVLITASDCLEAMSETLLGIDAAPENAQQVLQDVLDWANRLDKEGLRDEYTETLGSTAKVSQEQAGEEQENPKEKESMSSENMLRIPTRLADDMLRLAGENLISNVQVQAHIKNTLDRQEALKLHNHSLQQLSSDLEHLIDIQGITSNLNVTDDEEFDPLELDQYHELHSVSRRLVEITADSVQHASVLEQELLELKNLIIAQDQLHKENQELVLRTRMVPIRTVIPRLKRGVRQACRLTGKNVDLTVNDNDTSMDSEVLNGLIEPLMHLLRNAVDHGIESAEERQQLNKAETGQIQLNFTRKGEKIVISVRDDGRGLDSEQIRMQAVEKQLITGDHEILAEEINRLILEPGFTTRQGVTHVSGRGIGLDVVNVKIRDLKGSIAIESRLGKGCNFELTLPISSFSTHSLLVRVREFVYAISSRGIEEILYPGAGEISDIGDETVYQLGDQTYRTLLIDSVLGLPHDRRRIERQSRPIILVRDESGVRTAIMVQDVLSSIDVVVKPMGHYLPKVKGIVGATVLGDGSVAPVIDLPEMLFELAYRELAGDDEETPGFVAARLPYVLVVDDSLSARRSLAQFVEDLGLEVRTARDGMEAVSLIEVRKPDLLLVDMEMPKMNGLELTSHVRGTDNIKNLPIIMITSRSTDKHRKTAEAKGVNHFMVKPFAEDELAGYINSLLEAS